MVARYSDSARYADHAEEITTITTAADQLRAKAVDLAEQDAAAFTAVTEAHRLPKETPDAAAARSEAIAGALVRAAHVPAVVIAVAERVLSLTEQLLPIGNWNVVSDVAAAEAARAAATTARSTWRSTWAASRNRRPGARRSPTTWRSWRPWTR
jgi:formiminotetrahydrofolate cyclodeaminase